VVECRNATRLGEGREGGGGVRRCAVPRTAVGNAMVEEPIPFEQWA